jgi:hypothetical protein
MASDIAPKAGKNDLGPNAARNRLITNGTPPTPMDAATEKRAESEEVSSARCLAMDMVMA